MSVRLLYEQMQPDPVAAVALSLKGEPPYNSKQDYHRQKIPTLLHCIVLLRRKSEHTGRCCQMQEKAQATLPHFQCYRNSKTFYT